MRVPHDTHVMVADGRKMLFFRNAGDAEYLQLELVTMDEQDNPPNREQKTDAPGRSFSSAGYGSSAMEEPDYHQIEEDRFATKTADLLKRKALAGDIGRLIVVAPPRTLGEMRRHYHKEVLSRIDGEIAKDLTGHPVDAIERIILKAE